MRNAKKFLALFSALLVSGIVYGTEPVPGQAPTAATDIQPDVTIVDGTEGEITEYRVAGRLYMIKVTPKKGREYYLVDSDGDGHMDTRRNELAPNLLIPTWVLIKW